MSPQYLSLLAPNPAPAVPRPKGQPLGRYLVDSGIITSDQLIRALRMQLTLGAPIGEILVSEGWASNEDIQTALACQYAVPRADLSKQKPDPRLCQKMPFSFWLHHQVIPWIGSEGEVLIATDRPDKFQAVQRALGETFAQVQPVLASNQQIEAAISDQFAIPMAEAAGTRVAEKFSCRSWQPGSRRRLAALFFLLMLGLAVAPTQLFGLLCFVSIGTLTMFAVLKLVAFLAYLTDHRDNACATGKDQGSKAQTRLPKVSVLVPLFREREIACALIERLNRLTYPKALLDVILVLEEHDDITHDTLAETDLPAWMRVIQVPAHGGLTTKPRAMNYALDFCRGDIIGVLDAEDAPAADQIERVADRFMTAPDDVVCLQGVLDYYNPRTNWLARCFTIEYASWFRIVLPGIARLGLAVPLGGTTLFFKRDKLEELGGWDAHNVTEDADLGMRLCRAGYRTEMIDTVTFEEANFRVWPWIKQRSRWLKGFMVTYLVHTRNPRRLLSDLGGWRFLSFQAFFLGTLCQFLLAPVLWSFWLILLGLGHPLQSLLPSTAVYSIAGLFIFAELLVISIGLCAVSSPERRFLMRWVPTMMLYFPLAVVAAYKALYELVLRPFYWDKTRHGQAEAEIQTG